ncbi:NAD(P)H-hydrate epimerase, partial [Rhodococcus rhodnii]
MRGYYTAAEVRDAEAPQLAVLPEGTLMRRAAYGVARVVADELRSRTGGVVGRSVGLLVGTGDNGGDALWAGALLRRRGVVVTACPVDPERMHAAGAAALRRAGGRIASGALPDDVDLVIDGILGISGKGGLRRPAAALVEQVSAPIVAVDLPSGVDCDTGAVDGAAVRADVTVTFGLLRRVHALAAAMCGRVELVPIGIESGDAGLVQLDAADVGQMWPVPGAHDDKYTQGVVGVVAGSPGYPGAGILCTSGAVAATSGMVRYAGPDTAAIVGHRPEIVAAPDIASTGRVQAWVIGPGIGTDDDALERVRAVLATDLPVVVDADGLTLLAREPDLVRARSAPTLLTPHDREFARLTGAEPGADRVGAVAGLARAWSATVLLKGRATIVSDGVGAAFVNDAGGSWPSTAGSGDVLSGIVGALAASGLAL